MSEMNTTLPNRSRAARTAGAIASVHFIGYAMGAFAAAFAITRPRGILLGTLGLIAASTIAMGMTDSHAVWFGSRWLAGFCSALVLVIVSTYHIRTLSGPAHGNLQGWVFAGVGAGIMLAGTGVLVMMMAAAASKTMWLIFGGLSVAGTIYLLVQQPDLFQPSPGTDTTQESRRTPLAWTIILPYAAMGFGYIVPATYLPVMAREILPSPLVFGLGWPVFGAAAAVSTILIGRLQALYSNRAICPMAKANVMAATWRCASSGPATRCASFMPAIVMTMKVPPTHTAAVMIAGIDCDTAGASRPSAITA